MTPLYYNYQNAQFAVFLCKKGFLFFNLSGIDQFIREKKKWILIVLVKCRLRENGLLSILSRSSRGR